MVQLDRTGLICNTIEKKDWTDVRHNQKGVLDLSVIQLERSTGLICDTVKKEDWTYL